jgi:hypothetical protein
MRKNAKRQWESSNASLNFLANINVDFDQAEMSETIMIRYPWKKKAGCPQVLESLANLNGHCGPHASVGQNSFPRSSNRFNV